MGVRNQSRSRTIAVMALLAGSTMAMSGCSKKGDRDTDAPDGAVTEQAAQRYIKKAIRSSSEGVILMPSSRAEPYYDPATLTDLAQSLRAPAAGCFVNRAIETIRPAVVDGEKTFVDVPEGQLKLRVRVAPDGKVLRTELLESGFGDESMETCVAKVIKQRRWPVTRAGNVQFMDLVYWASLGFQDDRRSESSQTYERKEQAKAGIRAKECLQGRVDAGTYAVSGVNLVDREGATMVNRVEPAPLPKPVLSCIAQAFKAIRLPMSGNAFVRPVAPKAEFVVAADGTVKVSDEDWLSLIMAEERAARARDRAKLGVDTDEQAKAPPPPTADAAPADTAATADAAAPADAPPATPDGGDPASKPAAPEPGVDQEPKADPGQGGLRLNLSGPRE